MNSIKVILEVGCLYHYKNDVCDIIEDVSKSIKITNHDDSYLLLEDIDFEKFMLICMKVNDLTEYFQGYYMNYISGSFSIYKNNVIDFAIIENDRTTTDKLKEDYEYYSQLLKQK